MAHETKKCVCCKVTIPNAGDATTEGDLCDKCKDNPERRDFFKRIKEAGEKTFAYMVCPIEGYLLRIIEYNAEGEPSKYFCPKCKRETTESQLRVYDPTGPGYKSFCEQTKHGEEVGRFQPAKAAQYLTQEYLFKTDRTTDRLYFYNPETGKWSKDGEIYLKEILAEWLKEENRLSHYNNILHDLKSLTHEDVVFSTKQIACENGLLNLETKRLSKFTPNEMTFYSIPVKYNPEAKCPNWEKFVKQVQPNQSDAALLQEWSGYLLLPDYRKHKILWNHGEGRNGKGVWDRTMEGILGAENVSHVGLEEFNGDRRFAMFRLYGKLYNSSSEPTTTKILQTPLLKRVSGQDTIEAEIKIVQQTFSFRNAAKMTIIGNKFPRVRDNTIAFDDRILFLKWNTTNICKNQIDDLEQVWLSNPEERSGILNWMLEGLLIVLTQGFTSSKSQEETHLEFLRVSDSAGAFLAEAGLFDRALATPRKEAYEEYKEYCDFIGTEPVSDKEFSARLRNTPKIKDGWLRVIGKTERAWIGLGLKKLEDLATDTTDATQKNNSLENFQDSSNRISKSELKKYVESVEGVAEEESDVGYEQLVCFFCQKPITDMKWTSDNFSNNRPAHQDCYDKKQSQLRPGEAS